MTTPNEDALKDRGTWERWKKKHGPGRSPEEIMKALQQKPSEFTKDPNNPFVIMKREQEKMEEGE